MSNTSNLTLNHVHARVRDLGAAVSWFETMLELTATYRDDRLAVFSLGSFSLLLDASDVDSAMTLGFESRDCDADFHTVVAKGAIAIGHDRRVPNDLYDRASGLKRRIELLLLLRKRRGERPRLHRSVRSKSQDQVLVVAVAEEPVLVVAVRPRREPSVGSDAERSPELLLNLLFGGPFAQPVQRSCVEIRTHVRAAHEQDCGHKHPHVTLSDWLVLKRSRACDHSASTRGAFRSARVWAMTFRRAARAR